MQEQDLSLKNRPWLIYHKTKPNQGTFHNNMVTEERVNQRAIYYPKITPVAFFSLPILSASTKIKGSAH